MHFNYLWLKGITDCSRHSIVTLKKVLERLDTLRYVEIRFIKEGHVLEFSEFANTLWGILAKGTNAAPFTRELFKRITDIPDNVDPNPIDEPGDPTFKAYFTGDRRLTRFAPKIASYRVM